MDIQSIRSELPVTQQLAYLNAGTSGPLPRATVAAITQHLELQLLGGRSNFKLFFEDYLPKLLPDLRARFGRWLNARPDEIALTHHTTEGMNIATWGINWRPGDEIVVNTQEHEGGLLPVFAAARRYGLTVRTVSLAPEEPALEKLLAAFSPRTRLVMVSHVSFKTGQIFPLKELAQAAHKIGALVAVDGAQSLGAMPVDVQALDVDFYAVPGQKWLCGPEGVGALYVNRERLSELAPTFVGYFSAKDGNAVDAFGHFAPPASAVRYEVGTVFIPAYYGMQASLSWLEERVGMDWLFERTQTITRFCREQVRELPGVRVITPADHAGLTTFSVEGVDALTAPLKLYEQGIVLRSVPGTNWLRTSTGFFNTEDDVERMVAGIRGLVV